MFDARMGAKGWQIRTEPVIDGGRGSGYNEASVGNNDSVESLSAFAGANNPSESPFGDLRNQLEASEKEAVYFERNHPNKERDEAFARLSLPGPRPASNSAAADRLNNVAIARVFAGQFPAVDPSESALLWFAFAPPAPRSDGTNPMLFQMWDDSHQGTRFRRASWEQFSASPQLVSSAVFHWAGKKISTDGSLVNLSYSDMVDPQGIAARYEVEESTSFNGLRLPLKFKLTRFSPGRSANDPPRVSSTFAAFVTKIGPLATNALLAVKVPGKASVEDYRPSKAGQRPRTGAYLLEPNSLPMLEQLDKSQTNGGPSRPR